MSYNLYAILIKIIYLFFTKINLFNVIDQKENKYHAHISL